MSTPPEWGAALQSVVYVTREEQGQIEELAARCVAVDGRFDNALWYEGLRPILGDRLPPPYSGPVRIEVTDNSSGWLDMPKKTEV